MGIISSIGNFFSGDSKFLSWGKSRGKSVLNFGLGSWGEYKKLKFHSWNSDVDKRIDKTDQCFVSTTRDIPIGNKICEIPSFLHELKIKKSDNKDAPQIIFNGREYILDPITMNGANVVDNSGNKLYQIIRLNYGILDADKGKAVKTYAIWIDKSNNISSVNVAGHKQTYNFSGKTKLFSAIDRNVNTGEKNWLTTLLISWPLGLCAYLIKAVGYRVPDIIFDKIPKLLDRAIVPLLSAAIFGPIYIIGNIGIFLLCDIPQKIIQKFKPDFNVDNLYEKFSKPFGKILEFNRNIIKNGTTGWLKTDILNENDTIVKYKGLQNGSFTPSDNEKSTIKNKYYILKAMNGFSHTLNAVNLCISNFANIISSGLKGVANLILYVAHGLDNGYLDSAKFLFTEPFKITQDEFKEEFGIAKTPQVENPRSTRGHTTNDVKHNHEPDKDENYLKNAMESGKNLYSSGVTRGAGVTTMSYNTIPSANTLFSGKKLNVSPMAV